MNMNIVNDYLNNALVYTESYYDRINYIADTKDIFKLTGIKYIVIADTMNISNLEQFIKLKDIIEDDVLVIHQNRLYISRFVNYESQDIIKYRGNTILNNTAGRVFKNKFHSGTRIQRREVLKG